MPTSSSPESMSSGALDAETRSVVDACAEVHRRVGPGLPRAVYLEALCVELSSAELPFQRNVTLPIFYRGVRLDAVYPVDVCVAASVLVDVRTVDSINRIHRTEVRAKLRASGLGSGVLVNFNTARFGDGLVVIRRTAPHARDRLAYYLALVDQPTLFGNESNDDSRAAG